MLVAPLRNSMRMYEAGAQLGAGNGTGTNVSTCRPTLGAWGSRSRFVHDIGVDVVRKGDARPLRLWVGRPVQDLLLEHGAVAPTGIVLGLSQVVHLSRLVDTVFALTKLTSRVG